MMAEVKDFLEDIISKDALFKGLDNDIGIQLIQEALEYKVNEALNENVNEINELYYPQSEIILLSMLMYKIGYLRFKKPLQIKASLVSIDDVVLNEDTRFTNGESVFFLNSTQAFTGGIASDVYLTLKQVYKKTVEITGVTLTQRVPLDVTYKELVGVNISINGKLLKYSQLFISEYSEFSYEIDVATGKVFVVIKLGNSNANNLKLNDMLDIETIVAPDIDTAPSGINIIESGYNLIVDDIAVDKNYEPPMDVEEMQSYVRYGRSNIGDINMNEDYRQLILRNIRDIDEIKVWQEKEEEKEVGADISHIGKVFVSYVHALGTNLDTEIAKLIQDTIYGKEAVIKDAIIVPLNVTFKLTTKTAITDESKSVFKELISGIYDDIRHPITTATLYSKGFQYFKNIPDLEIEVILSEKGAYKNRNFFQILPDNITISVSTL